MHVNDERGLPPMEEEAATKWMWEARAGIAKIQQAMSFQFVEVSLVCKFLEGEGDLPMSK